jgi:hypothetical protein
MMYIDRVIGVRIQYIRVDIHVAHKEKDKNCLKTWLKSLEVR